MQNIEKKLKYKIKCLQHTLSQWFLWKTLSGVIQVFFVVKNSKSEDWHSFPSNTCNLKVN